MYQLTTSTSIKRLSDGLFLPPDNNGTPEWREYLDWLNKGNEPLPYVPPTPIDHIMNLQEAKEFLETIIKSTAYQYLQPTDWYVVRFIETGTQIPENVSMFRTSIRSESQTKIITSKSKESLEDLRDYLRSSEYTTWSVL